MPTLNKRWLIPPDQLELPAQTIHVWRASLEQPAPILQHMQSLLSSDEEAKAAQFRFERDRQHFIGARGILRTLLGRYLDADPHSVRFTYNAYGKPALEPFSQGREPALRFNLAHSEDLVLYAFTTEGRLGIDLEYIRPDIDCEQLARHSFSAYEQATLLALPPEERLQAFYRCWTRKEAYIKARGLGLSLPLDSFDVSLKPGESAAVLDSREDPRESARWTLWDVTPGEGYAGALAAEGNDWHVQQLHMVFS